MSVTSGNPSSCFAHRRAHENEAIQPAFLASLGIDCQILPVRRMAALRLGKSAVNHYDDPARAYGIVYVVFDLANGFDGDGVSQPKVIACRRETWPLLDWGTAAHGSHLSCQRRLVALRFGHRRCNRSGVRPDLRAACRTQLSSNAHWPAFVRNFDVVIAASKIGGPIARRSVRAPPAIVDPNRHHFCGEWPARDAFRAFHRGRFELHGLDSDHEPLCIEHVLYRSGES